MSLTRIEISRRYRARQKILNPRPPQGKHGNHAKGSRNGRWNSGALRSSHGYILVRVPKTHHRAFGPARCSHGYAYEHDLIMEAHTGRPLLDSEIVHHKNHNKTDNRIENLEIQTKSAHMKHHDMLRGRDDLGRFKRTKTISQWPQPLT